MDLGLAGKVALVAGASRGLGLAIAQALAAEGAAVSIGARDQARLHAAAAAVRGEVLPFAVDVRDPDGVAAWVAATVERFGGLHVVVANAGGPPPGPATAFALEDYRAAVELSLLSQIGLVQATLPHLRTAGWGRVLFVASQSVVQPLPHLALSSTARAGVVGYAASLVADLGGAGITVNVLAPGSHRTDRLEQVAGGPDGVAAIAAGIPLGRVGEPEELAAAAAFLASERAAFITGAVLTVDGGATSGR